MMGFNGSCSIQKAGSESGANNEKVKINPASY